MVGWEESWAPMHNPPTLWPRVQVCSRIEGALLDLFNNFPLSARGRERSPASALDTVKWYIHSMLRTSRTGRAKVNTPRILEWHHNDAGYINYNKAHGEFQGQLAVLRNQLWTGELEDRRLKEAEGDAGEDQEDPHMSPNPSTQD